MKFECVFDPMYFTLCCSQQGKIFGFCIDLDFTREKAEGYVCLWILCARDHKFLKNLGTTSKFYIPEW